MIGRKFLVDRRRHPGRYPSNLPRICLGRGCYHTENTDGYDGSFVTMGSSTQSSHIALGACNASDFVSIVRMLRPRSRWLTARNFGRTLGIGVEKRESGFSACLAGPHLCTVFFLPLCCIVLHGIVVPLWPVYMISMLQ